MDSDTVFVRGLNEGTHHEELNEVFSEIGPVKSAFIVVHKNGPKKGISRGFGFVQFAIAEDAEDAVSKLQGKEIAGRNMILELAGKKGTKFTGSRRTSPLDSKPVSRRLENVDDIDDFKSSSVKASVEHADTDVRNWSLSKKIFHEIASKVIRNEIDASIFKFKLRKKSLDLSDLAYIEDAIRARAVVFYDIPAEMTSSVVKRKVGKAGRVFTIKFPYDPESRFEVERRSALVIYAKHNSAGLACSKLSGKLWSLDSSNAISGGESEHSQMAESTVVSCRRIVQIACNIKAQERCRLIVRNLWFNTTDKSLRETFSPFGPILEAKIVTKDDDTKTSKGFGFVQFACRADATEAVKHVNNTKIGPRNVAVDFAITKDGYDRMKSNIDDQNDTDDEENEVLSDSKEESEPKKGDESSGDDSHEDDSATDDNDSVADDDGSVASQKKAAKSKDDSLESELEHTIFVRNVLFETTEDELFDVFRKFGPVRYVKLTKDSKGRSRGTGFVNYYGRRGMVAALKKAETVPAQPGAVPALKTSNNEANPVGGCGISCAGRPLLVVPALNRSNAKDAEKSNGNKRERKDKRHLYLLKEGLIHSSHEVEVPKADLTKREHAEAEKRSKIKNPIFFVSPLRLSVRNIFRGSKDMGYSDAITQPQLKQCFLRAAISGLRDGLVNDTDGDMSLFPPGWPDKSKLKSPRIVNTLIMFDQNSTPPSTTLDDVDMNANPGKPCANKNGRSKGYGFVEFTEHAHALAALRVLNNNPEYSEFAAGGPASKSVPLSQRSRLIVEFAVENAAKLHVQEKKRSKALRPLDSDHRNALNDAKSWKSGNKKNIAKDQVANLKAMSASADRGKTEKIAIHRKRVRVEPNSNDSVLSAGTNLKKQKTEKVEKSAKSRRKTKDNPKEAGQNSEEYRQLVEKFKSEIRDQIGKSAA